MKRTLLAEAQVITMSPNGPKAERIDNVKNQLLESGNRLLDENESSCR